MLLLALAACTPDKPPATADTGRADTDLPDTDSGDPDSAPDSGDTDTAADTDTAVDTDTAEPDPTWADACAVPPPGTCAAPGSTNAWTRLTPDAATVTVAVEAEYGGHALLGDIDGDGAGELALVEGDDGAATLRVLSGGALAEGRVEAIVTCALDARLSDRSAIGDVDGDGRDELLVNSNTSGQALLLLRGEDLAAGVCAPIDTTPGGWGSAQPVGDVDGDGRDDLWLAGPRSTWTPVAWDGAAFVAIGAAIPYSGVWVDVSGDGVRDRYSRDGTTMSAWDGLDGAALGAMTDAPWFDGYDAPAYHDWGGLAPVGEPDCPRALVAADDVTLQAWSPERWAGDGSALATVPLAVDTAMARTELTPLGDLDGDGLGDAAWLDADDPGSVCLFEGRFLDGRVRAPHGLRCFDGAYVSASTGPTQRWDLHDDGRPDLVLAHSATADWPHGALLVYAGGPFEDCDCDGDGSTSAVCGGRDAEDADATRHAGVREDPANGQDDDGDGTIDETAAAGDALLENGWMLHADAAGRRPADAALLPDTDGDGAPELVYAASFEYPWSLTTRLVRTSELGAARETTGRFVSDAAEGHAFVAAWDGGFVAPGDRATLDVWSAPDATGAVTLLASLTAEDGATASPAWFEAAAGDIDGDGVDDLLVQRWRASSHDLVRFDGAALRGGIDDRVYLAAEGEWEMVETALGDLDGDGAAEVLATAFRPYPSQDRAVLLASPAAGDTTLAPAWTSEGGLPVLFGVTDGDGDGYGDVVVHDTFLADQRGIFVVRGGLTVATALTLADASALYLGTSSGNVFGVATDGYAVFGDSVHDEPLHVVALAGTGVLTLDEAGALSFDAPALDGRIDAARTGDTLWIAAGTNTPTLAGEGGYGLAFAPLFLD